MPLSTCMSYSNQRLLTVVVLLLGLTVNAVRGAIVIQPSDTVVYQGGTAYLYCQFSVPPKPSGAPCFWTRSGTFIVMEEFSGIYDWIGDYQKGNCSFQITGADIVRDDAQWICQLPATASSPNGEKSVTAKLNVYKTPTPPSIEHNDTDIMTTTNLTVNVNETQEFTCESHSGNPAAQLTWSMDHKNMKPNEEKSEVEDNQKTYKKISELDITFTKDDNGKVLRCSMSHVTMNETSLFVDVKINVKYVTTKVEAVSPTYVVVDEGSGYQFTCVADGNPPAKCEWLYNRGDADNWEIKSDSCIYDIVSADYSNEGKYMCLAGNTAVMLPSQVITFDLRSTKRNVVAIIGGVFGGILLIAIIVLAVVVWKLRKKIKEEAAEQLPDIETLNRATSESRPKKRGASSPTESNYMLPMPTERAPLNPPLYSPSPYNPLIPPRPFEFRAKSESWRRDPESHIYAEPHFYDTVDGHGNAQPNDLCHDPTDDPPKLPSGPPSPDGTATDDGTYLAFTSEYDSNNRESTA